MYYACIYCNIDCSLSVYDDDDDDDYQHPAEMKEKQLSDTS